MFDAVVGLDEGEHIKIKLDGGSLFVWNEDGRVSVSVSPDGDDILQVELDSKTMEVLSVVSPNDCIEIPVKVWSEVCRASRASQGAGAV